jgi:hypothetical protein
MVNPFLVETDEPDHPVTSNVPRSISPMNDLGPHNLPRLSTPPMQSRDFALPSADPPPTSVHDEANLLAERLKDMEIEMSHLKQERDEARNSARFYKAVAFATIEKVLTVPAVPSRTNILGARSSLLIFPSSTVKTMKTWMNGSRRSRPSSPTLKQEISISSESFLFSFTAMHPSGLLHLEKKAELVLPVGMHGKPPYETVSTFQITR